MKNFLKLLMLSIFLQLGTMASADTRMDLPGTLTPTQKSQIVAMAAQMATNNASAIPTSGVQEWSEITNRLSDGLIKVARNLNVSVDEFVRSPIGTMTGVILLWTCVGKSLGGILFGIIWFSVAVPIWCWFFYKYCYATTTDYAEDGKTVLSITKEENMSEGGVMLFCVFLVLLCSVGLVAIFA